MRRQGECRESKIGARIGIIGHHPKYGKRERTQLDRLPRTFWDRQPPSMQAAGKDIQDRKTFALTFAVTSTFHSTCCGSSGISYCHRWWNICLYCSCMVPAYERHCFFPCSFRASNQSHEHGIRLARTENYHLRPTTSQYPHGPIVCAPRSFIMLLTLHSAACYNSSIHFGSQEASQGRARLIEGLLF